MPDRTVDVNERIRFIKLECLGARDVRHFYSSSRSNHHSKPISGLELDLKMHRKDWCKPRNSLVQEVFQEGAIVRNDREYSDDCEDSESSVRDHTWFDSVAT